MFIRKGGTGDVGREEGRENGTKEGRNEERKQMDKASQSCVSATKNALLRRNPPLSDSPSLHGFHVHDVQCLGFCFRGVTAQNSGECIRTLTCARICTIARACLCTIARVYMHL